MKILTLNQAEVRRLLDPEALLDGLAKGFELLSAGRVSAPPRIAATVPDAGLLAAMPTHVPGFGLGAKLERRSESESTVYKSMGHAMEDMLAGALVLDEARRHGLGRGVDV